jgi:hypothetical protein
MPFSRGLFVYGDPIHVAPRADADEAASALAAMNRILNALSERADREA